MSSASPPTAPSAAEQSTGARVGAVLFRNRSWLPVPFVLVALLAPAHANGWNWVIGFVPIVIGYKIWVYRVFRSTVTESTVAESEKMY